MGGDTSATSGVVRLSGQDVGALSDAGRTRLRKTTVSFVFQKFNLLPNLTAGDNIALARFLSGKNHAQDPEAAARFQEVRLMTPAGILNQIAFVGFIMSPGLQQPGL